MLEDFKTFISHERLLKPGQSVLLGVSGGMDSVAMCQLFHLIKQPFAIAHCNFLLRGDESQGDEAFTRKLASAYGVPFFLKRFNTKSFAKKNSLSIQMAARELRMNWFKQLIKDHGYRKIALAHHLDDQLETFFLNIMRGTGLAGMHGILPVQGAIIHPLLFASRYEIESFVRQSQLDYREDSSNASLKYARNKIRHKLIPLLEEMKPSSRTVINRNIHRLRETEKLLKYFVNGFMMEASFSKDGLVYIDLHKLKEIKHLHPLLSEILSPYGFNYAVAKDIADSVYSEPGKEFLSKDFRLLKDRDYLIISPCDSPQNDAFLIQKGDDAIQTPLTAKFEYLLNDDTYFLSKEAFIADLDMDALSFPLEIRKWRQADRFIPLGMDKHKKLSDFFVDQKINVIEKESLWILCSADGRIAWIMGYRLSDVFKVKPGTRNILRINISPIG